MAKYFDQPSVWLPINLEYPGGKKTILHKLTWVSCIPLVSSLYHALLAFWGFLIFWPVLFFWVEYGVSLLFTGCTSFIYCFGVHYSCLFLSSFLPSFHLFAAFPMHVQLRISITWSFSPKNLAPITLSHLLFSLCSTSFHFCVFLQCSVLLAFFSGISNFGLALAGCPRGSK